MTLVSDGRSTLPQPTASRVPPPAQPGIMGGGAVDARPNLDSSSSSPPPLAPFTYSQPSRVPQSSPQVAPDLSASSSQRQPASHNSPAAVQPAHTGGTGTPMMGSRPSMSASSLSSGVIVLDDDPTMDEVTFLSPNSSTPSTTVNVSTMQSSRVSSTASSSSSSSSSSVIDPAPTISTTSTTTASTLAPLASQAPPVRELQLMLPYGGIPWAEKPIAAPRALLKSLLVASVVPNAVPIAHSKEELDALNACMNKQCYLTGQHPGRHNTFFGLAIHCSPRCLSVRNDMSASSLRSTQKVSEADQVGLVKLCKCIRLLIHDVLAKPVTAEEVPPIVFQVMFEIRECVESSPSLLKLVEETISHELEFWNWKTMTFSSSACHFADDTIAEPFAIIQQLAQWLQTWVEQLENSTEGFLFPVFPLRPSGTDQVTILEPQKQSEALQKLPKMRPVIGVYVSAEAYAMGMQGDPEFQVRPLAGRGFGSLINRDYIDNFRIMQYRNSKGKLFYISDWVPLLTFQPQATQATTFLNQFRAAMSRIAYATEDRFSLNLLSRVVPHLLFSISKSFFKKGGVDPEQLYEALDAYTMLDFTSMFIATHLNFQNRDGVFTDGYTRWMQFSLFRPRYSGSFPSLEEAICSLSLAVVPWAHVRDALFRELFLRCLKRYPLKKKSTALQAKSHLESCCMNIFRRFLILLAVHSAHQTPREKYSRYMRTLGVLPATDKQHLIDFFKGVSQVKRLEQVCSMSGMLPVKTPPQVVTKHILGLVSWALQHYENPYQIPEGIEELPIAAPTVEEQQFFVLQEVGTYEYVRVIEEAKQKGHREEAARHGAKYPKLDITVGKLHKTTCSECGASFTSRNKLFVHLRRFYPSMVPRLHAEHYILKSPFGEHTHNGNVIRCSARNCGELFEGVSPEEAQRKFQDHLMAMGTQGDWPKFPVQQQPTPTPITTIASASPALIPQPRPAPQPSQSILSSFPAPPTTSTPTPSPTSASTITSSSSSASASASSTASRQQQQQQQQPRPLRKRQQKKEMAAGLRLPGSCVVCSERLVSAMLLPCGHQATCERCAVGLINSTASQRLCPLCSTPISTLSQVTAL
ncbi:hypothetical protein Pelo_7950 [Pelomyxa schiedti]|nr:hypothetical protein Pelo_7950 [Pelomyxa schiedti]